MYRPPRWIGYLLDIREVDRLLTHRYLLTERRNRLAGKIDAVIPALYVRNQGVLNVNKRWQRLGCSIGPV